MSRRQGGATRLEFAAGLAETRWVVERHDGAISLGPGAEGRGARVTIDLPVADARARANEDGRKPARTGAA